MDEKRNRWSEGRRWYDGNRGAIIIAYGVVAVIGFAMGGVVGYIIGRMSCLLFG